MEGVLENVPAVRLESRHRLVGQTPFLAYLRSSSASLALLCSIVEEKSFLSKLAMTVLQDPGFPSPYLSLGFFVSSNGHTLNTSVIDREYTLHDTHPETEHHYGKRHQRTPLQLPWLAMEPQTASRYNHVALSLCSDMCDMRSRSRASRMIPMTMP